jgi:type II secretory pathway component PulF
MGEYLMLDHHTEEPQLREQLERTTTDWSGLGVLLLAVVTFCTVLIALLALLVALLLIVIGLVSLFIQPLLGLTYLAGGVLLAGLGLLILWLISKLPRRTDDD